MQGGVRPVLDMVDPETISKAVQLLRQAANPRRIILFGSYASGDPQEDSDVDLLVVEHDVPDVVAEMVRLRRSLSPLRIPVDVFVVSESHFEYWADTPGNLMYEIASDGEVLYEAA